MRLFYLSAGILAIVVGVIGIFVPLLPTVPFMLLAAFCFARSNPEWERRLIEHPRYGPHILAWREKGAISRKGKTASLLMLTGSAIIGLVFLPYPWCYTPLGVALICGTWIATRPSG
ncbi:YbaN family protein [Sphingomonas naphthae]|uniref:YbaN family protein n=1 Tax=Sphingomonas naphthae TaxID=1813468 RepID=A0ABY7TFI2_9SPHN|nr:YbaN family protein [Sphingomonas naphthae]WCT72002.1 YbaN family protein [Sphingomonas naphthae]